jgi:uncharacterized membrane protein YraQ (UPF0718 family)
VFFVALFVLAHVLGWLAFMFNLVLSLLMFAAVGYGIYYLVKPKKSNSQKSISYKLSGTTAQIHIFRNEPELKDLVNQNNEMHIAKLELAGEVFPVPKDTHVIILEDSGKEAVKIRIKGSKNKFDSEGWVDRSSLVTETKQIKG